jgi:hypothetical protein
MTNEKTSDEGGRAARPILRGAPLLLLRGVATLVAGASVFLPGTWVDGVVLPLLAAAYKEHDEAEDEHDEAPGQIEVDAHGFFVDVGGVAGDEAVEAHQASDEEEDEAEGDADVESHKKLQGVGNRE